MSWEMGIRNGDCDDRERNLVPLEGLLTICPSGEAGASTGGPESYFWTERSVVGRSVSATIINFDRLKLFHKKTKGGSSNSKPHTRPANLQKWIRQGQDSAPTHQLSIYVFVFIKTRYAVSQNSVSPKSILLE
jgi:hypothetical protein